MDVVPNMAILEAGRAAAWRGEAVSLLLEREERSQKEGVMSIVDRWYPASASCRVGRGGAG